MIGQWFFDGMTKDLDGTPCQENARSFDRVLNTMTGCNLSWHRKRQMFVVYRDRGPNTPPRLYNAEFGRDQWPLRLSVPSARKRCPARARLCDGNGEMASQNVI